jgi:hypothetical protein
MRMRNSLCAMRETRGKQWLKATVQAAGVESDGAGGRSRKRRCRPQGSKAKVQEAGVESDGASRRSRKQRCKRQVVVMANASGMQRGNPEAFVCVVGYADGRSSGRAVSASDRKP